MRVALIGSGAREHALARALLADPEVEAVVAAPGNPGMAADGVDLILAGHTHGGQLCLPGYGALVTNCDLDRRRAKGMSRWWPGAGSTGPEGGAAPSSDAPPDAAWLHVSAGLGTSPYAPVRFACRPEATLLTLTPRDADARTGARMG